MTTATADKKETTNGKANGKEGANGETTKREVKRRSMDDIKKLKNKGVLILMSQRGFALAKQNEWKGVTVGVMDEKTDKEKQVSVKEAYEASSIGGTGYALTKEGGRIMRLGEEGEEYKKILTLAKKAKGDMENDKYTQSVQEFLTGLFNLQAPSAPKATGAVLKSISFE